MSTTPRAVTHRYQRWSGTLDAGRWSWLAIVVNGLRLGYKRPEMKLFVWSGSICVVGACIIFYVISLLEILMDRQEAKEPVAFLRFFLGVDVSGIGRISEYRELLWNATYLVFLRVELISALLVLASVGPGLIADDLKTRALPIYFARPVQPWSYLVGKGGVAVVFLGLVTLVPNLLSVILGTMITGGVGTWTQTFSLAGKLAAASLGVMVVGTLLSLAMSSFSSDKRYVTMGLLAICVIPLPIQRILNEQLPAKFMSGFLGCLSLRHDFTFLFEWLFDFRNALSATGLPPEAFEQALGRSVAVQYPAIVLIGVAVTSAIVCYRRVVRFTRAAANV